MLHSALNRTPRKAAPITERESQICGRQQQICVVGDEKNARDVKNCLKDLNVGSVFYSEVKNLTSKLDPRVKSIIFVEPLIGVHSAIENLNKSSSFRNKPLFVVTKSPLKNTLMKDLYKLGVEAVLLFPDEKPIFSFIIGHIENDRGISEPFHGLRKGLRNILKSNLDRIGIFGMSKIPILQSGFRMKKFPRLPKSQSIDSKFDHQLMSKCRDNDLPLEAISICKFYQ